MRSLVAYLFLFLFAAEAWAQYPFDATCEEEPRSWACTLPARNLDLRIGEGGEDFDGNPVGYVVTLEVSEAGVGEAITAKLQATATRGSTTLSDSADYTLYVAPIGCRVSGLELSSDDRQARLSGRVGGDDNRRVIRSPPEQPGEVLDSVALVGDAGGKDGLRAGVRAYMRKFDFTVLAETEECSPLTTDP